MFAKIVQVLVIIAFANPIGLVDAMQMFYNNMCWNRECNLQTDAHSMTPTSGPVATKSTMLDDTLVYFVNHSLASDPTIDRFNNTVRVILELDNVIEDPCTDSCNESCCWMQVHYQTDFPFEYNALGGVYKYDKPILGFFVIFIYEFPIHNITANFTISIELCIVNPITPNHNHCNNACPSGSNCPFQAIPLKLTYNDPINNTTN